MRGLRGLSIGHMKIAARRPERRDEDPRHRRGLDHLHGLAARWRHGPSGTTAPGMPTSPWRCSRLPTCRPPSSAPDTVRRGRDRLVDLAMSSPTPSPACHYRRRGHRPLQTRTQGPAVSVADRHHSLRLDLLTMTRSVHLQVRCAVVALWSENPARYAVQIRLARAKPDSIFPALPSPVSLGSRPHFAHGPS